LGHEKSVNRPASDAHTLRYFPNAGAGKVHFGGLVRIESSTAATQPFPPVLGVSDSSTDSLSDQLPLKLRDACQDVQQQPGRGVCLVGVNGLTDR
jgi:hypothetical protein